jgi:hypothetical protein
MHSSCHFFAISHRNNVRPISVFFGWFSISRNRERIGIAKELFTQWTVSFQGDRTSKSLPTDKLGASVRPSSVGTPREEWLLDLIDGFFLGLLDIAFASYRFRDYQERDCGPLG